MAKKLKYPYEQWKEQQNKPNSRSPSPMEAVEDEGFSSSSSSPQTLIPHGSMSPRTDYPEAFAAAARHAIYGKWCSMLHVRESILSIGHKISQFRFWESSTAIKIPIKWGPKFVTENVAKK